MMTFLFARRWHARRVRWSVTIVGTSAALLLAGCSPDGNSPSVPTLEWNQQKYGPPPARRALSSVEITVDKDWVVAREKTAPASPADPATPTMSAAADRAHVSMMRLSIGGVDCGDCQHLVAQELGKLVGIRQARISQGAFSTFPVSGSSRINAPTVATKVGGSQTPPEAVVEYDPAKLSDKQIEGTVAGLGLLPKSLPPENNTQEVP